ncbi:hypothetical protein [Streptomyces canus]|uniref:hypothetical protein n=1 Tax=Streptomyces canus TaxID=58343 RepID=UPI003255BFFA
MVRALTVTDPGVDFPHAAQVAKIVRRRTSAKTGKRTRESVYVITDLTSRQASPERIAQIVRSQWVIETGSISGGTPPFARCLQGPHRTRTGEHGHSPQLRDRPAPRRRQHQHRHRTL